MNRVCEILGIRYPIVQGGMAWCSGAKLAAAVSEAGGLGLVGGGSMNPDLFREHIRKARRLTGRPVGVNIPLTFKHSAQLVEVALEEKVPVVFISAGSPKRYTSTFKENGSVVFHVVSTPEQAVKCQQAGVDGVVAEGFEAGGHNGREELTTMVLVAQAARLVDIPVLAAGGIATGRHLAAALALGAEGVQVGTRFALTQESSAHPAFKQFCLAAGSDSTRLVLKKAIPVRMMKNPFFQKIVEAEDRGASREELLQILGEGRPRRGMFEGDIDDGVLEIGQVVAMIDDLPTCRQVIDSMMEEYELARKELPSFTP
ncbi:MAG: nitronate monooxygenase [Deltaproteobacteria bacterium]|nr:MAG: nitronate monooxygenase [Deltaproteobacteria bacterium]